MNKLNIQIVRHLSKTIGGFATTKMSIEIMRKFVKLNKTLSAIDKEFTELQQEILKSYDLEPNEQGAYNWQGHENEKAISEKLQELFNEGFEVPSEELNFLSEEDFFKAAGNEMTINELTFLSDFLIQSEVEAGPKEKPAKAGKKAKMKKA